MGIFQSGSRGDSPFAAPNSGIFAARVWGEMFPRKHFGAGIGEVSPALRIPRPIKNTVIPLRF